MKSSSIDLPAEPPVTLLDRLETVRHLRPAQIAWLLKRRVIDKTLERSLPAAPSETPRVADPPFARIPFLQQPAARAFSSDNDTITLLNRQAEHRIPAQWNRSDMGKLWVTELNYFHWLRPEIGYEKGKSYLMDWIANAPHAPHTPAWDAFAVAQRILHWTRLLDAWRHEWQSDPDRATILSDLYRQSRFLAKHQQFEFLGNHLIKTAAGLFAAGVFFDTDEAHAWRRKAADILVSESAEQILPDGGHYERSPMYHLLVLQDLLDVINMCPRQEAPADMLTPVVNSMLAFAVECSDPDGRILLLNDSFFDQAPTTQDIAEYASRVTDTLPPSRPNSPTSFPAFGIYHMGAGGWDIRVDGGKVGPDFLPAHAHTDTAGVLAWYNGHPVLVDSGCFCYDDDPARRRYDRSPYAHNVLTIDGHGSSKCWATFRVARRPSRVHADHADATHLSIEHDGFSHMKGAPVHTRELSLDRNAVHIEDTVKFRSPTPCTLQLSWHFAPGARLPEPGKKDDAWLIYIDSGAGRLIMRITGADSVSLHTRPASRRFHVDEESPVLVVNTRIAAAAAASIVTHLAAQ